MVIITFCIGLHIMLASSSMAFMQKVYLDRDERFQLAWEFNETDIKFTATVDTLGWFGVGFSSRGGMRGADIIVAGVENGKPYLWDMHSVEKMPVMDKSSDVTLISGTETDGKTVVTFQRKVDACDPEDLPITTDTMKVIYAISPDNTDNIKYHSAAPRFRGTKSLYLRKKLSTSHALPEDAISFDITVKDITISHDSDTTYFCQLIKVPELAGKHHLVQVDPLIQKDNIGLVHHIMLYGCYDNVNRDHYFKINKTGYSCYNGDIPRDIDRCRIPVATWGIGGQSNYYPQEAGLAFGDSKSPKYLMMEMHYDNSMLKEGQRDNSGMRLILTKTLRKYDAGIMPTGIEFGIAVPPDVEDFTQSSFCTSDCTGRRLNKTITVFAAELHAHLAARKIITRQFRNGKEVGMIAYDNSFDASYQQFSLLQEYKQIMPGDEIMVTCHYNTKGRTRMTYGNLPITQEMCIAYLFYYPAQDIGECFSAPSWIVNNTYFLKTLQFPDTGKNSSYKDILDNATANGLWTEEKVLAIQRAQLTEPHVDLCTDRTYHYIFEANKAYKPPKSGLLPPPIFAKKESVTKG